jgi:signal peptidase II
MKQRIRLSVFIALTVIVLDQITKYLARTHIGAYESIELLPMLNLVNVQNRGAAFGMFRSFGNTFFISISVAALIFMSWVIIKDKEDHRIFALLAGGAAGNLIDRLTLGYVVDFVDVAAAGHHWPAFNVADSALSIGMVFMALSILRKKS